MKRYILLSFAAILAFAACNQRQHDEEMALAKQRQDSLQAIVDARDSQMDELFTTLTQIEEAIAAVSTKYGQVSEMRQRNPEASYDVKTEIAQQLNNLDRMLDENKKKIAYLNEKLQAYGKEKGSIQEFVEKLEQRIAEQEQQIASLSAEIEGQKAVIADLNQNVSDLTAANEEKANIIAAQIIEANKAFYIVGTYDELKSDGVVVKSGGVLGMGRKQMLSDDLPLNFFTQIDLSTTTNINVNLKNAVVLSTHPQSSYELVYSKSNPKVVDHLHILDPTSFWQTTRYLVISTK